MADVIKIELMMMEGHGGISYDLIGNITYMDGNAYSYQVGGSTKPHAVSQVGANSYSYDSNGNMNSRAGTTIIWDLENKPRQYGADKYYYYDGDGNRVKEVDSGTTTVYINKYYEKNITTSETTTHYYLKGKQVAVRKGSTVSFLIQEQLSSTSVAADTGGNSTGTIRYYPFGFARATTGTIPTDKKYTGQRLDSTGLYYYNARYYDPVIARFLSPDSVSPDLANPQTLNRYSYVLNNPLKYIDPSGNWPNIIGGLKSAASSVTRAAQATVNVVKANITVIQTALDVAGMIPVVGEVADAVNGVIYAARGDIVNAGLSFTSMVPVAGNIVTVAKLAVKSVDTAAGVVKTVEKAGEAVADAAESARPLTRGNFRANLIDETGVTKAEVKGYDAHHSLPVKHEADFERAGFTGADNIHNPQYGAWWEEGPHRANAHDYNEDWGTFIRDNPGFTKPEALDYARSLAGLYGFGVMF